MSLSGFISPRGADPNRESSFTWYRRHSSSSFYYPRIGKLTWSSQSLEPDDSRVTHRSFHPLRLPAGYRLALGVFFSSRLRCLSPYRNAGLSIQRAKLIDANALGGGRDYQFHPDGIRTLEVRSLGSLAQGVDAVLLLPGGRVGETRQLEHDP